MEPEKNTLSYADPSSPLPASGYGIASIVLGSTTIIWHFGDFAFNSTKQARIESAAWLLDLLLVIAAYRQPQRSRTTARVGMALWVVATSSIVLFKRL